MRHSKATLAVVAWACAARLRRVERYSATRMGADATLGSKAVGGTGSTGLHMRGRSKLVSCLLYAHSPDEDVRTTLDLMCLMWVTQPDD